MAPRWHKSHIFRWQKDIIKNSMGNVNAVLNLNNVSDNCNCVWTDWKN